jgi:hypothetical protein
VFALVASLRHTASVMSRLRPWFKRLAIYAFLLAAKVGYKGPLKNMTAAIAATTRRKSCI